MLLSGDTTLVYIGSNVKRPYVGRYKFGFTMLLVGPRYPSGHYREEPTGARGSIRIDVVTTCFEIMPAGAVCTKCVLGRIGIKQQHVHIDIHVYSTKFVYTICFPDLTFYFVMYFHKGILLQTNLMLWIKIYLHFTWLMGVHNAIPLILFSLKAIPGTFRGIHVCVVRGAPLEQSAVNSRLKDRVCLGEYIQLHFLLSILIF